MNKYLVFVFISWCALSGQWNLSAQEQLDDSLSQILLSQLISSSKSSKEFVSLYQDKLCDIRYRRDVFDRSFQLLFASHNYDVAIAALEFNPFLMSQHNEQAMYYYFRGIGQMLDPRKWEHFKEAERSMNMACMFLERSYSPDYGFFSDVENARGYLSIVARGESTDKDKRRVCIVRQDFMYDAIYHFREALAYNPDNVIAQQNLDTLYSKLRQANIPIPPHKYAGNIVLNPSIMTDSVNIDSLNDVSMIPLLDYSLLPRQYEVILRELSVYDEVILLIDLSGSMDDPVEWSNEASKFAVAHQLSIFIALKLKANVFLGAISVGQECDNTSMVLHYPIASVSRQSLTTELAGMSPYGHTPLNRRLRMTRDMFSAKSNKKIVFLLSDGMDTCGENPDLCGTAAMLAAHGIDLSVFSFIYETLDEESRSAYSIYNCMVHPSQGKIYKITRDGGVRDQIDYIPISNNLLILPPMDTSMLWRNNKGLYQFDIDGVEPPIERIMQLGKN